MVRDDKTDAVVYWTRFDAPAATTDSESSKRTAIGRTVWKAPVSEAGDYSVYADADVRADATDSNWAASGLPDSGCMGVDVIVSRDGELRIQVYSQSCQ